MPISRAVLAALTSIQTARSKLAQPDPLWDRVLDSFGWLVGIGGFAVSAMDDIASGLHPTVYGDLGLVLGVAGLAQAAAVYDLRRRRRLKRWERLARHQAILNSILWQISKLPSP